MQMLVHDKLYRFSLKFSISEPQSNYSTVHEQRYSSYPNPVQQILKDQN
jgi:hypothetical protein